MGRWGERRWKNSWWRSVAGKSKWRRGIWKAPENGKESSHSAHENGMNEHSEYHRIAKRWFVVGGFPKGRKATISFIMSVRPSVRMEQLGSRSTDFHEIWYLRFFENISRKFKLHQNLEKKIGTLYEDQYAFFIICNSMLLGIKKVSNEIWRKNKSTHFVFNNFISENSDVYEIILKYVVQSDRSEMTM